jgi:hypothetical protein
LPISRGRNKRQGRRWQFKPRSSNGWPLSLLVLGGGGRYHGHHGVPRLAAVVSPTYFALSFMFEVILGVWLVAKDYLIPKFNLLIMLGFEALIFRESEPLRN